MRNLFVCSVLLVLMISCGHQSEEKLLRDSENVIKKVEQFRRENNSLPSSMTQLGLEERVDGPVFYELLDSTDYIVWFFIEAGTGQAAIFNSRTDEWFVE